MQDEHRLSVKLFLHIFVGVLLPFSSYAHDGQDEFLSAINSLDTSVIIPSNHIEVKKTVRRKKTESSSGNSRSKVGERKKKQI